jgi:hypothetical protein
MTKIALTAVLLLPLASAACGAPFTAGELFPPTGEAGDAQASAGAAGVPSAGGAAGDGTSGGGFGGVLVPPSGGETGVGGSASTAGAFGGGAGAGAPSGGAPSTYVPCANPRTVVGGPTGGVSGNLGVMGSSSPNGPAACIRTPDIFNFLTCTGIPRDSNDVVELRVNGAVAQCSLVASYPPPIDGYTYFEVGAGSADGSFFRWEWRKP